MFRSCAIASSIGGLLASTALAQSAPSPDDPGDSSSGSIVVTAQRREQAVNKVPMSIQAFSGSQMERYRITDVADLGAVVPSFHVVPTSQGIPNYYIRGVGFNTFNQSSTSTVGTYVDEVAYAYPIMNAGPVFDMERVEVLKGPQGTLFGRNTTAGLIDLVTRKPTDHFEARIVGEAGNFQTHNFEGAISGPIANGIDARLAFRTEDADEGWQKSLSRDERLGEVHRYGARLSVAMTPTDRLKADFSYNVWLNRSDTIAGQMIAFTPAVDPARGTAFSKFNAPTLINFFNTYRPTSGSDADWSLAARRAQSDGTPGVEGYAKGLDGPLAEDTQFHGLKLKLDYDLADRIHIISLTGYNRLDRQSNQDWSGAPLELRVMKIDGRIRSFNQEARIEGETRHINWMAGGYYGRDKLYDSALTYKGDDATSAGVRASTSALLGTPINSGGYTVNNVATAFRVYRDSGHFTASTWSAFANADWQIIPKLTLTTGVRYTQDRQNFIGCTADYEGNMTPIFNVFNRNNWSKLASSNGVAPAPVGINGCATYSQATNSFGAYQARVNEHNVAWRVALKWAPVEQLLLYASASRGAKNAAVPVNSATRAEQIQPAKQETLLAYEIGLKASLLDRKLLINAAGFYYDYKDKQALGNFRDPVYTVLTQLANIPKSEAYGLDGDITLRPLKGLTLSAAGTYLRTKILDWQTIGTVGQDINLKGGHFAYSPKLSGNLTASYDRAISETLRTSLDLNGHFQGHSNATSQGDPLYRLNGYAILNGTLAIYAPAQGWKLSFWGRNLTNKYYWTQVLSNSNSVVRYAGRTRTFGLTASMEF